MEYACGVSEIAHDLAAFINPHGSGYGAPVDIELSKDILIEKEAMTYAPGIEETAHDLAAIIDPGGQCKTRPGHRTE